MNSSVPTFDINMTTEDLKTMRDIKQCEVITELARAIVTVIRCRDLLKMQKCKS